MMQIIFESNKLINITNLRQDVTCMNAHIVLHWNWTICSNNSQNINFKWGITKYAYWLNYGLCIVFNKHEFSKMLLI
jgi:hypothetical protein